MGATMYRKCTTVCHVVSLGPTDPVLCKKMFDFHSAIALASLEWVKDQISAWECAPCIKKGIAGQEA